MIRVNDIYVDNIVNNIVINWTCLEYGNIMNVETSGASSKTAIAYGNGLTGGRWPLFHIPPYNYWVPHKTILFIEERIMSWTLHCPRQYCKHIIFPKGGVQASEKMASDDLDRMESYKTIIGNVARKHDVDPALIAAVASRESRGGAAISGTKGLGDNGNGYGLMQVRGLHLYSAAITYYHVKGLMWCDKSISLIMTHSSSLKQPQYLCLASTILWI